jgi:hypothetical protein
MASNRPALTRFLIERQRAGRINADLRLLIETCARACKAIGFQVDKGALAAMGASLGIQNVQAEEQKKLDVVSNEILLEANEWGGNLAALASEEMEHPAQIPSAYPRGEYLLLFDPLDGSSNIDVNIPSARSSRCCAARTRSRRRTSPASCRRDAPRSQPASRRTARARSWYSPSATARMASRSIPT